MASSIEVQDQQYTVHGSKQPVQNKVWFPLPTSDTTATGKKALTWSGIWIGRLLKGDEVQFFKSNPLSSLAPRQDVWDQKFQVHQARGVGWPFLKPHDNVPPMQPIQRKLLWSLSTTLIAHGGKSIAIASIVFRSPDCLIDPTGWLFAIRRWSRRLVALIRRCIYSGLVLSYWTWWNS